MPEAVARLKKFIAEHQGTQVCFITQPVDYDVETRVSGKILFQVANTNCDARKKLLGFRREIVLEFYAHPDEFSPTNKPLHPA